MLRAAHDLSHAASAAAARSGDALRSVTAWGLTPLGLPWFSQNAGAWSRQPLVPHAALPEVLRDLAACPAGARLCFRTDAACVRLRLAIDAGAPDPPRNIPLTGSGGAEIWVDGAFWSITAARDPLGAVDARIQLASPPPPGGDPGTARRAAPRWREICVYLPYYAPVADVALEVCGPGTIAPPPQPAMPIAFYGSSVTHGACASRSSLTFPARIARALDCDFVNLGMTNAAPPELAALLARVPAAAYVLELGTNHYAAPDRFPAACDAVFGVLRAARPTTPIIAFSPVTSGPAVGVLKRGLNQTAGLDAVRAATRSIVQRRISAGDHSLTFVDGLDLLGPAEADCLADDLHPNDHGHALIAERLTPHIRRALDQS